MSPNDLCVGCLNSYVKVMSFSVMFITVLLSCSISKESEHDELFEFFFRDKKMIMKR